MILTKELCSQFPQFQIFNGKKILDHDEYKNNICYVKYSIVNGGQHEGKNLTFLYNDRFPL